MHFIKVTRWSVVLSIDNNIKKGAKWQKLEYRVITMSLAKLKQATKGFTGKLHRISIVETLQRTRSFKEFLKEHSELIAADNTSSCVA